MRVYPRADPIIEEYHSNALDCSRATARTTSIKSIEIAVLDISLFF